MTTDLDALIAEARAIARHGNGPQWESDAEHALTDLADALESTLAELRQERAKVRGLGFSLEGTQADFSRAEETIEKVRAEAVAYAGQPDVMEPCGAVAQSLHFIINEYGKQKGADRG